MHEYSIASALLDRVDVAVRDQGATAARRIRVRLGELAGVDAELLREAFSLARMRTVSAQAELEVVAVPASWRCSPCDREIAPGHVLCCPGCGAPARLAGGDEIVLDRVEMEVASV